MRNFVNSFMFMSKNVTAEKSRKANIHKYFIPPTTLTSSTSSAANELSFCVMTSIGNFIWSLVPINGATQRGPAVASHFQLASITILLGCVMVSATTVVISMNIDTVH